MNFNRRIFLQGAGAVGIGASRIWAQSQTSGKKAAEGEGAISKIRVAQIKIYPEKGKMEVNHQKLAKVLKEIEKEEAVDVVVTPEGFLDGYVSTEKSVGKEDMVRYAIEPQTDHAQKTLRDKGYTNVTRKMLPGVRHSSLPAKVWEVADELAGK